MTEIAHLTSTEDFEFDALNDARNYRQAIFNEFAPFVRGDVLEVGAGIGQMTELLQRHRPLKRLLCAEPNLEFCAKHRAQFPKVELVAGTITDLPSETACDAILSVNVLEHIRDDVGELTNYLRLLEEKRGHLCLLVPARPEIYSPIDRRFGHYRRYTRHELCDKLRASKLEIKKLFYFNWIGYFAWLIKFRLLRREEFTASQVRFYDSALFPFVNWTERNVFRPPIGQSLVAIAAASTDAGTHCPARRAVALRVGG